MNQPLTLEELTILQKADAIRARIQETRKHVRCPDCDADLKIEGVPNLPEDTRLVFVRHRT
jgi:hypothetical protein